MPNTDIATMRNLKQGLIRKPLAGAVLMAPYATAIPTAFTAATTADLQSLTGFTSLGHISKEGSPTFSVETETNDIEAWGLPEAARTDIISRSTSVSWTGLETHKTNLELFHNTTISATPDATTGEVSFTDPTTPSTVYRRAIFVSVDGAGTNAIFIIKVMPKFTVTEIGEQQWSEEGALEYPITGVAKTDDVLGYAVRTVFGGPGWKALSASHGF
ncbi:hypothetical protein [Rhodococcus sp. ACS1]|uniref:phage tail tube protein n=1 Tax=Rhodococcus sp. ACS1 TaxID=2028570 RepID=UPI00117AF13D|nr:hypothetical protein [Rhodococcus sp. ACS1]